MKPSLGPDSVIPKWFYFVYNVFCFGLMHHYRVSGPRSAKKVAPSKEVPIQTSKKNKTKKKWKDQKYEKVSTTELLNKFEKFDVNEILAK